MMRPLIPCETCISDDNCTRTRLVTLSLSSATIVIACCVLSHHALNLIPMPPAGRPPVIVSSADLVGLVGWIFAAGSTMLPLAVCQALPSPARRDQLRSPDIPRPPMGCTP